MGTCFSIKHVDAECREAKNEIGCVVYETNLFGWKGPRKMTLIIPSTEELESGINAYSIYGKDSSLISQYESTKHVDTPGISSIIVLKNKQPQWNEETQSYVLNFGGRVTVASVKNFQIVHENDRNVSLNLVDYIVMQFGRVGRDTFTLDYQYPLCAIQAFGIALSSFDFKLACE